MEYRENWKTTEKNVIKCTGRVNTQIEEMPKIFYKISVSNKNISTHKYTEKCKCIDAATPE